jgi:hypothetical protein
MTPSEKYLQHLDDIFEQEPEFYSHESAIKGAPDITAIVYKDVPEKGYITAFTYGLSLVKHPDWENGRPELCISVASPHLNWAMVAGYIANQLRGECPFAYGETIHFGQPIAADSTMDAFFIFAPSTIEADDYLDINIGLDYNINIAGLYPIYSSELGLYEKIGLQEFWMHPDYDNYSIDRAPIA